MDHIHSKIVIKNNKLIIYGLPDRNILSTYNIPMPHGIEVDDNVWADANWTQIDPQTSFSTNCDNACSTTGINDVSYKTIRAYPNPFSASTTIDRSVPQSSSLTITS